MNRKPEAQLEGQAEDAEFIFSAGKGAVMGPSPMEIKRRRNIKPKGGVFYLPLFERGGDLLTRLDLPTFTCSYLLPHLRDGIIPEFRGPVGLYILGRRRRSSRKKKLLGHGDSPGKLETDSGELDSKETERQTMETEKPE